MFDNLVSVAASTDGARAVGAWARVENAAAARRLASMADILEARLSADGSAERDQWCLDNWDAVAAEVAAAQGVSLGVASHELLVAWGLRERLPRVEEVFAAGAISYRMAKTVVARTRLIVDPDARAKVDTEIAAHVADWGPLSMARVETAIDYWVDRYDPYALVRTEQASKSRHVAVVHASNGAGLAYIECVLFAHDGIALDDRLDEMARGVCERDPRTLDQRRSDALGALAVKADRLQCACDSKDCPAAEHTPSAVVVHVIAEENSLAAEIAAEAAESAVDGALSPGPGTDELRKMTVAEALATPPPTGPSAAKPALIVGGGVLPAVIVAARLAASATIRRLIHPGQSPPERGYVPSQKLADFVRCRDMTCRFPGCDVPADRCDLDHTIAYPGGPTQASNLKCLCRKHHLLKTFWGGPGGWSDVQSPDGTVAWTSPGGHTHTTVPGSRLMFPTLCRPTAPVETKSAAAAKVSGLGMPRRRQTRAKRSAERIGELRRKNDDYVARRNEPPPF